VSDTEKVPTREEIELRAYETGEIGRNQRSSALAQWVRTRIRTYVLVLVSSLLIIGSALPGLGVHGQQSAPDNTKTNRGDANKDATTSDQQKMNTIDQNISKRIRSSIMKDKSLSTYAHNIKIIAQAGIVTLRGPVRSEDERSAVEAKAQNIAGASNVRSELTVAPPKQ